MRVLTLENMDKVRLQRSFNYNAITSRPFRIVIRALRYLKKEKDHITLGDVYRYFEQGLRFHEVKEKLVSEKIIFQQDIENKTLLMAEAFYLAINPGVKGFKSANVVRALCDENIDEHYATHGAMRTFGHASHTTFEDLTGKPDSLVWQRATKQEFDVIISKDTAQKSGNKTFETRDLTNCAEDAWKDILSRNGGVIDAEIRALPVLIHIKNADATGKDIRKMLQRHKTEIYNLIQQRKSPVIELKKGRRPQIGKHYLELVDGDREEKRQKLIDKRVEQFIKLDHLNLGKNVLMEYSPTIRGLIENDVDKIMLEQKHNAEVLMLTLNDCINRIDKIGAMTLNAQRNLIKQINNEKSHKELIARHQKRREEFYSRKPHLHPHLRTA